MIQLEKIAEVLEKVAAFLDAQEAEKQQEIRDNRMKLASMLQEKYEELTGDALDEDALEKIAGADTDVLAAFEKLTSSSRVSEMGGPSDQRSRSIPMTKKEAADAADEKFLNFIMSE